MEYGLNASAVDFDGKNKYIRITDIDENSHKFLKDNLTSPDIDLSSSNNYLLQTGDILFARTGASVGKSYIYDDKDGKVYYAGFLIRARINSKYEPEFVFQNTLTSKYDNFITISSQRSGQPGVNAQEYSNYSIMTPNLEEQKKIGYLFKHLDDTIALHQEQLNKLKLLKKGFMQVIFPQKEEMVPKLRFANFDGKWEQRKLGDISESIEYGLNASAVDFDGENKYVRITDIDDTSNEFLKVNLTSPNIDLTSANNYLLKPGDILFARTGASVGKTYIYDDKDGKVYYAGFLIRARINSKYDSEFVFQNTLTTHYNNFITITSQRSGQPGVNAQEYSNYSIMTPNLAEQRRVGELFKQLDNTIALHHAKLEKFQLLKKVYLQKMFI